MIFTMELRLDLNYILDSISQIQTIINKIFAINFRKISKQRKISLRSQNIIVEKWSHYNLSNTQKSIFYLL
jgi:hypothetical protein